MRFAPCACLDSNTVLKKLMLWQSTALGALPAALQLASLSGAAQALT
jgi:hypothetical protein